MSKYRETCQCSDAVDRVISSIYKHSWYLDSTLIPLALLDSEVPEEEKRTIADAIFSHRMPSANPDEYKAGDKPKVDIWERIKLDQEAPSLVPMVDEFSDVCCQWL